MINSRLNLAGNSEIYSSLDISILDLFVGKVELLKNGACSTYIKNKKNIRKIDSTSMPVGIVNNIELQSNRTIPNVKFPSPALSNTNISNRAATNPARSSPANTRPLTNMEPSPTTRSTTTATRHSTPPTRPWQMPTRRFFSEAVWESTVTMIWTR